MKVLVTGGQGMIGSWVVRVLLESGHTPIVLDTSDVPGPAMTGLASEVQCHIGDVRDLERVGELLRGVDAVAHLAVILPAVGDPFTAYAINALGPVTIFEAARRAGIERVVWASAKAVYGELSGVYGHPRYEPVPETHPRGVLPYSPVYCASKYLAEEAGRHYASTFDMEILALRFSTIFGPGKVGPRGPAVVGAIISSGVGGPPVALAHGGEERDEIIYVRDAAAGVVAAILAPRPAGRVYNVASGILVTLAEVAEATRAALGEVQASIGPGLDPFDIGLMYGRLDDRLARMQLNYEPAWGLEAAVHDFAAAITRGGAPAAMR